MLEPSRAENSDAAPQRRSSRKYRFFFSYASKSDDPRLRRFYSDLTDRVWALTGGDREDVSFFDKDTMKTGARWQELMLQALQSSQVLVYMVSSFYIESAYCGRELQIFLEREEKYRKLNPGETDRLLLRPVVWTPLLREMPPALGGIQWRDNSLPTDFVRRGLQTYMSESDQTVYNRLVESLAASIVEAAKDDPLPPAGPYSRVEDIPNAFEVRPHVLPAMPDEESAPRMKCIYVAPRESEIREFRQNTAGYRSGGWSWRPYFPDDSTTIGPLLQRFITDFLHDRIEVPSEGEDLETRIVNLVRSLREAAMKDEIVLVVVDAWAAYLQQYRVFLEKFDTEIPYNHVILVPWNESDQETAANSSELQMRLTLLFRSKSQIPQYFKPRITSIGELEKILPDLLRTMRLMIDTYRADRRKVIQPTRTSPPVVRTAGSSQYA